jgi:quercetin dioxygenase-like cupin family protein
VSTQPGSGAGSAPAEALASVGAFEAFEAEHRALGFDEVLVREWGPGHATGEHCHPFAVRALVVKGGFVLGCQGQERPLGPGDRFALDAEVPHTEVYGPEGATFWVARRQLPPRDAST